MIDPKVRRQVLERDGWCCVRCGQDISNGWDYECHHRRLKGQGGQDEPTCLVTLCRGCHQLVHSRRVTVGEPEGFIVPSWQDPADIPVTHHALGAVCLTVDGGYEKVRVEGVSSV